MIHPRRLAIPLLASCSLCVYPALNAQVLGPRHGEPPCAGRCTVRFREQPSSCTDQGRYRALEKGAFQLGPLGSRRSIQARSTS